MIFHAKLLRLVEKSNCSIATSYSFVNTETTLRIHGTIRVSRLRDCFCVHSAEDDTQVLSTVFFVGRHSNLLIPVLVRNSQVFFFFEKILRLLKVLQVVADHFETQ